jgi:hypothetical protein
MKSSRLLLTVILALGLTLALLWMLRGPSGPALAETGLAPIPPSLARQHDPVVITGGLLSDLTGNPLHDIFVYAYRGTALAQIPFQIDERDGSGVYVPAEDGHLDDNDELVFMAMDGGDWVSRPSLDADGAFITPTYVITLTDPLSDTHAWAYVFYSSALSRTFTADYVSYDQGNDRITGPGRYAIGFDAIYAFRDYLSLGDSSVDLLDREKLRITGTVYSPPYPRFSISVDEEDIAKSGVHVIDGPVRVTRVSTITLSIVPGVSAQGTYVLFAYRSLVVQPTPLTVPSAPFQIDHLRTSMDWNEQASGMTYYDANNPTGTTIDGSPAVITVTPATRWAQVTGITGTVVNVSQIPAGLGGAQSTYYKDDSAVDTDDTGDQRSYGDAGVQVDGPDPGSHIMLGHIYFLTGTAANVGTTYVGYYDDPVQVSVATFTPPKQYVYLPLMAKGY